MIRFYRSFGRLSLRNKLLIFMMSLVVFVASVMGILIRFVIFPHLTQEMEGRGLAAAQRLAETSRSYIVQDDKASLTALFLDEMALEQNIAYVIATDSTGRLVAHTNPNAAPQTDTTPLLRPGMHSNNNEARATITSLGNVLDIVVPVREGDRRVGTIRLGLDNRFIHSVLRKLSLYQLGFVGFITLLGMVFGLYLSRIIVRPITSLTQLAKEISQGNLNACIALGSQEKCWEITQCGRQECPARNDETVRCWFSGRFEECERRVDGGLPPADECKDCRVYKTQMGDEITQLADAFNHMTRRLRLSENELRLSEQRYRLLFNRDPNPVFVVELGSYSVVDANERATEKYGYARSELLGMKFTDLGFPEDSSRIMAAFQDSDKGDEPCFLFPRMRHRQKNGGAFWVNVYFCRYEYSGNPAIIATTTDITEIIEAETQLIQAGKMATLGEMSTGIAHELNQPLNAIKLGSEFLQTMIELGKPIPNEDLLQVTHDLGKEVDRASSIINHLREFGRKSDISKHRIDLNVPIRGALTILGQQLKVHGIELILDQDETLPPILADQNRVEQVLVNLINNARDALDSRREAGLQTETAILIIRSYVEGDQVVVTVGDNGGGIPEAVGDRIFEPFFTTKGVGKGTGLGLSISYGIVRDYEGAISFVTEEGVGTVFKVSFPKAPDET